MSVLVCVGGLPATGKSTVSGLVARALGAPFVRIDTIEAALTGQGVDCSGGAGYAVGYGIAAEQLRLGLDVVAESVNALGVTRRAWREVAAEAGAAVVEVEIICADATERRRRAETRSVDVAGLRLPSWADIVAREYEPWDSERLVVDTANMRPAEAAAVILRAVRP